jgi:hypothetical protein
MDFKEYYTIQDILDSASPDSMVNEDIRDIANFIKGKIEGVASRDSLERFLGLVNKYVGQHYRGGLGHLPSDILRGIKSKILDFINTRRGLRPGFDGRSDYPPIKISGLCSDQRGCSSEVEAALAIINKSNHGSKVDKHYLLPIMAAYNAMLKRTMASPTIDFWAYYNGLRNFYSNPETMLMSPELKKQAPTPAEIEELPHPSEKDVAIVKDAAKAIEQSVKGTPYEDVVLVALKNAIREFTDEQLQDIAARDKRFRKNREEIKRSTGYSWRDISSSMKGDEELKSRYQRISRMMRRQGKSSPDSSEESWPRPPFMNYSEIK